MKLPEAWANEEALNEFLSEPSSALVELMHRLEGDIIILGIAGKMGVTMGRKAVNAIRAAGVNKTVYGVARFSNPAARAELEENGIRTIPCDLLDREAVAKLPAVPNVIFMAGRKFGTEGGEDLTWAMNVLVPEIVAEHFAKSKIVAFSTGCVYPLVSVEQGGCTEAVVPLPVGEYSQSCLGRERIFQYAARKNGTPILLFRLNYAIDMRYGVLHDIARQVWAGEKVDNSVGYFNVIWQGDANEAALRALELTSNPPSVLNVTGPETASVNDIAERFGKLMNKKVEYRHEQPGDRGYLNNAGKMAELFGYPSVSLDTMIKWQAAWIANGGSTFGKPTHFEVNNGKF